MSVQISKEERMSTKNWNIIGHEWAVKSLQQHVISGIQKQAYLITGPEGVGRRTLAIRFAQALNCLQLSGDGVPCLECSFCDQFERMVHPDLTVVESDGSGLQIKVDQVRDLQYDLHLAPYEAKYRIALLLRFEEANPFTNNALLKTLEEPPAKVIILITAESAERLLPTIVSRCEVIRLQQVPSLTLNQGLQSQWLVPPVEADLLAHISGGRPGYSFQLYQKPELIAQRNQWLADLINLLTANRIARFAFADNLRKNPSDIYALLRIWQGFWRDVMLRSTKSNSQISNIDYQEEIDRLSRDVQKVKAIEILTAIDRLFDLLDHNVNPRLAIEDLMLILPFDKN
jgi:DNA polymerase-3 subunit delta'